MKPKKEEKNFLSTILFKYLPYWPVFVVLMAVSVFCAWFYLRITPKLYEASASIMVTDESKGTNEGGIMKELNQLSSNKIIENEAEILKSRTLMIDVVRALHLYASFYEQSEMSPLSAYNSSPITIEATNPDAIKRPYKVEFSFSENDSSVIIGSARYPVNKVITTPYGELKFVPNKHFTGKSEKPLYFILKSCRGAAGSFASKLKASPSRTSTVITLTLRDEVPERSEEILNQLIIAYNNATIAEKNRLASTTLDFVDKRLAVVKSELEEIEEKSKTYKKTQGAVDISSQGQLYLKSVNDIDQKLSDINIQIAVLDEVDKYIRSKDKNAQLNPSTLGLKDPVLSDYLNRITEKELAYEKLKQTTGENNPLLVSIKGEIEKLKPAIMENIRNQRSSLEASKLNLHSTNNTFSSMLQNIPQKERELIEINRDQTIKTSIYQYLLQKRDAVELAIQGNMLDSRIVESASALPDPVAPKSSMIYMMALVFAVGLPVGFITVKGMFNRKISFRQEIENLTSYPIIGEVMLNKSKDPVVIQEGKRTFIAEQFRMIRTSLAYMGVNTAGKKRILVTSSLSGEGKSFVALNLSLSLAMTGKKVVLIELDLANPSLSTKLGVNYELGASNYLKGECEPEEIIKRTAVNNNLFFLPCGPLPENPSELLMSERLKDLLDYLDDIFDYVVIDSAPATLLSDAYVLSPLCHATLYVVKHKFTPKMYLERLDHESSVNQLHNLGIIFNGIRSRGFTKNGYGYGYGYGYIHDNSGKKVRAKAYKK